MRTLVAAALAATDLCIAAPAAAQLYAGRGLSPTYLAEDWASAPRAASARARAYAELAAPLLAAAVEQARAGQTPTLAPSRDLPRVDGASPLASCPSGGGIYVASQQIDIDRTRDVTALPTGTAVVTLKRDGCELSAVASYKFRVEARVRETVEPTFNTQNHNTGQRAVKHIGYALVAEGYAARAVPAH